ncbi:TrkA family potassium uptake protein [Halobacteriales archaeon QS_1_68_20]|nr:MAG: TrkA family potassium uptake protein [Halobacteriales archaeon QS_1_68_20]
MYLIVVGAGEIGTPLLEMATAAGHEVVAVENDEERADEAAGRFDCLVLNDDATGKETLEDAGAERADAIVSTTDRDAVNVMVMLLAEEFGIPQRVSVVRDAEHMDMFRQIGVHTIENPQQLIAEYLFRAVQRPSVQDFMHLAGDAEVFEITVGEDAPIAEMNLIDADEQGLLGEDVLVVALERGDETITPKGRTVVHAGDVATVFSKHGFDPGVLEVFTGERR